MNFRAGIDYERLYNSDWKWGLKRELLEQTSIHGAYVKTPYIELHQSGMLVLREGYAIDGVTCGLDTPRSMRAAFIHDAICQLVETKALATSWRRVGDREFLRLLRQDHFFHPWAVVRYLAVRAWSVAKNFFQKSAK